MAAKSRRKGADGEREVVRLSGAVQIPEVFARMPGAVLERYARHGVRGAKLELRRRARLVEQKRD